MEARSRPQPRLYERLVQDIRSMLAGGGYKIGDRLPSERELASQFKVSRPTVREAIIALELDGLVEVRTNSGVYVAALTPVGGVPSESDVGPFELLEARRTIESEVCALAAHHITEEEVAALDALVAEMDRSGIKDVARSEAADRAFHLKIAEATRNSAMLKTVAMLWDERDGSRQYRALSDKARQAGVRPQVSEHRPIVEALRNRDQPAARHAMWEHLNQVIEALLAATEVEAMERARAEVDAHRRRLATAGR